MTKDPHDWDWYVGDPCYHIDNDRWDEFCNALWEAENAIRTRLRNSYPDRYKNQSYISINEGVVFDWPVVDEWGDEDTVEIEVWSSPYGDGCWPFHNGARYMSTISCKYVKGKDIPVDAGIIAIVPKEACREDPEQTVGIYFKGTRPTLETTENDFEVKVNDITHDGIGECIECGREESHDSFYDDGSCYYCGPIDDYDEEEHW